MNIKVAMVDDHPAVLFGISQVLSDYACMTLVGAEQSAGGIVSLLTRTPCDVLVADYFMPGGKYDSGFPFLSLLRRRFPDLRIVVFTMGDTADLVEQLAKIGVHSVIHKSADPQLLIEAITSGWADPRAVRGAEQIASDIKQNIFLRLADLSVRELEVLRLYAHGYSISQIAKQTNRAKQTVSSQKIRAMQKLGISGDSDFFRAVWEQKLFGASGADDPDDNPNGAVAG
jgi:two-component system, NarL family, captular synthesis response regulator RcsB